MTIDDLLYVIGKMTVEREMLLRRIADLERALQEATAPPPPSVKDPALP